jgi:hypothetical protein
MDIKNSSKITKIFQMILRGVIGSDAATGLIYVPMMNDLTPNHDKSILELNTDSTNNEYLSKYVP